jgi:hypothetical protein
MMGIVTKTVVEETIIRADGSKTTNRKETITHGSSNASSGAIKSSQFPSSDDSKKKEKGGVLVYNCFRNGIGTRTSCFSKCSR